MPFGGDTQPSKMIKIKCIYWWEVLLQILEIVILILIMLLFKNQL